MEYEANLLNNRYRRGNFVIIRIHHDYELREWDTILLLKTINVILVNKIDVHALLMDS